MQSEESSGHISEEVTCRPPESLQNALLVLMETKNAFISMTFWGLSEFCLPGQHLLGVDDLPVVDNTSTTDSILDQKTGFLDQKTAEN